MIKLFWNSQNQKNPSLTITDEQKSRNQKWGIYHKKCSDKWIYETLSKVSYDIIQSEKDLENGDILIIVDSSVENKSILYDKLKLICSKIFLIHLGDEFKADNLSTIYNNCEYVWRTFCSNKFFEHNKVSCLPLGYKSGTILNKDINIRKYKWTFVGTAHKSSRHDLLFQLSNIKPYFNHKTKKFDEKIIDVKEMSKVLSSTIFIPCPNGFFHPETYRLYEALECGCIPIVENTYQYYERLFPNNPFLKINKWVEAKTKMEGWEDVKIKQKQQECQIWWKKYKIEIQEFFKKKINL